MKKVLLLLMVAALPLLAMAQDRIAVGLKTGFNSSKFTITDLDYRWQDVKEEAKAGYLFGAYARLRLVGNLSVQPELYYAKKEGKADYTIGNNDLGYDEGEMITTMKTWDLPILLHLRLLDLKVASVYGVAGPMASFNASSTTNLKQDIDFKNSTWTFQAGGGVEFWRLTADVRYEWGLNNVANGDLESTIGDVTFGKRSNVLTFSLGFKLLGL
jgi:hypothetical protein